MQLGVIGYGSRIKSITAIMRKFNLGARITAVADVRTREVEDELHQEGWDPEEVEIFREADRMLDETRLDGVLVGTRCSLHAEMACRVLKRDLPLFLEKPVATNLEDLRMLKRVYEDSASEVVVSFPLRLSPLVQIAREIVDSGRIGSVEHVQAHNNVPYGGNYYHGWYRDDAETGGLFLQKATHDFDYIDYLLDGEPVEIAAMSSEQVFTGDRPEGLACRDCGEWEACPESPFNLFYLRGETDAVRENERMCQFAVDTGNQDSGSTLIRYGDGMHVCYTQNFFARRNAATRGARLVGYKGTVDFDWYDEELRVYMHHSPRDETHRVEATGHAHGGGDKELVYDFLRIVRGDARSRAPLEAGILSALMCIRARESAAERSFKRVEW